MFLRTIPVRISPGKAGLTRRVGSGWLRWGRERREREERLLLLMLFNYVVVVVVVVIKIRCCC